MVAAAGRNEGTCASQGAPHKTVTSPLTVSLFALQPDRRTGADWADPASAGLGFPQQHNRAEAGQESHHGPHPARVAAARRQGRGVTHVGRWCSGRSVGSLPTASPWLGLAEQERAELRSSAGAACVPFYAHIAPIPALPGVCACASAAALLLPVAPLPPPLQPRSASTRPAGLLSLYLSNNSLGGTFPADWLLPSTVGNLIMGESRG